MSLAEMRTVLPKLSRAKALCLVLAAALHMSCSVKLTGELTRAQCTDDFDNDGDHKKNCEDPDCWVYEFCRPDAGTKTQDAGGKDARVADAAPIKDARMPNMPDDTGVEDGGSEPCGNKLCFGFTSCMNGDCQSTEPLPGNFSIQVDNARLRPVAVRLNKIPPTECWDCEGTFMGCFGHASTSQCMPDPYVELKVSGATNMVYDTMTAANRSWPTWSDAWTMRLAAGDKLELTVYDDDKDLGTGAEPMMLPCSWTLSNDTFSMTTNRVLRLNCHDSGVQTDAGAAGSGGTGGSGEQEVTDPQTVDLVLTWLGPAK